MKQNKKERLSGENRRAQIIDAALTLFAEKGFSATRTHEISQAAGISETLIFQHFKTKDELIRACLAVLFHPQPVSGELTAKLNSTEEDSDFFKTIALHMIEHNHKDPRILKLALFSALEGGHFGELTHTGETSPSILTLIAEYIRKGIDRGQFIEINNEIASRLFVETMFMYIADQAAEICGPRLPYSDDEVVDTIVNLFLKGIRKK